MNYFEFLNILASKIGIDGKQIVWAIPGGGPSPDRPSNFELFYEGIHEGQVMDISKIVTEQDAPEAFAEFFARRRAAN